MRMALWALGTTYGKDIVYSAPTFSSIEFESATETRNGRGLISMDHTGGVLKTVNAGTPIGGFAIAGSDRVFHSATATYNSTDGRVTVSSDNVKNPIAVRYNWADYPNGNLVNSAGLPAAPFRTDDWKIEAK